MGKVVYAMNVSLDGYIETGDRDLSWATVDDEVHAWWNDFARRADAFLYGRRVHELMAAYWPTAESDPDATEVMLQFARIWNATPKVVFSRTLGEADRTDTRVVRGDVGDVLGRLRAEFPGELQLGGATLAGEFVRRGLVDEYHLLVHPVVLGTGKPYFPELDRPLRLELRETQRFASSVVRLSYAPARDDR